MVFGITNDSSKTQEGNFSVELAERLAQGLSKNHNLRAVNINKWSHEFEKLLKHHPDLEITQVLKWYIEHSRDDFVPIALNASSFRRKYERIKEAMRRGGTPAGDYSHVKISPIAERMVEKLDSLYSWANPTQEALFPVFIQLTLDNYNTTIKAIQDVSFDLDEECGVKEKKTGVIRSRDRRLFRIAERIHFAAPAASEFVRLWTAKSHDLIVIYGFDMIDRVFRPTNPAFHNMMYQLTREYCGENKPWDALWELVKEKLSPELLKPQSR